MIQSYHRTAFFFYTCKEDAYIVTYHHTIAMLIDLFFHLAMFLVWLVSPYTTSSLDLCNCHPVCCKKTARHNSTRIQVSPHLYVGERRHVPSTTVWNQMPHAVLPVCAHQPVDWQQTACAAWHWRRSLCDGDTTHYKFSARSQWSWRDYQRCCILQSPMPPPS